MKTLKSVFTALALAALSACTINPESASTAPMPTAAPDDMIFASYGAAENLVRAPQGIVDHGKPILIASLVNINNLETSSALGRMIAEQMSSRLVTMGYSVVELKLRNSFLIKEGKGEFILSRDVRDISRSRGAQAVIAGTYAVGAKAVFVNVRLIRATDSKILAAHDYTLPLDENMVFLLGTRFRDVS